MQELLGSHHYAYFKVTLGLKSLSLNGSGYTHNLKATKDLNVETVLPGQKVHFQLALGSLPLPASPACVETCSSIDPALDFPLTQGSFHHSYKQAFSHWNLKFLNLLAPTGALVVMMVYYISEAATFSDFHSVP